MATKLNFCAFKKLPEKGVPGHLYFVKDTPTGAELLLASREGTLCPVTEFFNIQITEAHGADGRDGKDGRDGADGTPGPKGDKGDKGDVCYIGPAEVEEAVKNVRKALLQQRANFKARILEKMAATPEHPVYSIARAHLQSLLDETEKEIESL